MPTSGHSFLNALLIHWCPEFAEQLVREYYEADLGGAWVTICRELISRKDNISPERVPVAIQCLCKGRDSGVFGCRLRRMARQAVLALLDIISYEWHPAQSRMAVAAVLSNNNIHGDSAIIERVG